MTTRPPLPRTVWVLGFVSLLMDLSSEIYQSLLPAFITVALGLPVTTLGAIDGVAEATANFGKLFSGRLSDRTRRRKPWIVAGYGLAALSKPLFPLAASGGAVLFARFTDRVGKGIRGAPRDAMIADDTPPEIRGRAFGLRQALDTAGALLAPVVAIALMMLLAGRIRLVFWIAIVPAVASVLLAWLALREPEQRTASSKASPFFRGFRELDKGTKRLLAVGFLFTLARFSEPFLILKGMEAGLSESWSPITLALFNLAYLALAYPAGALSDRMSPRSILMAGIARPDRRQHRACEVGNSAGPVYRRGAVGRAHGDDAGHLLKDDRRQRAGEFAGNQFRRLLVRDRSGLTGGEPRRRLAVGPQRQQRDLPDQRGGCWRGAGDADAAGGGESFPSLSREGLGVGCD